MTIKVTYNVTDVYVSETISATYINISYEAPSSGGGAWGTITGTLSNQTDLQNALNGKFDDPTGTTSQYLRGDGTLATFPTIPSGTVQSVGLTMPSAFSVANSPVTSSGTLAVTGAGTAAQYIRGDGQLANFPDNQGGGSSVNYYLNGSVTQGTFGGDTYYEMSKIPILGAGTNFTRTNGQGNGYIASFITDAGDPSLLNIPAGNWNLEFYFQSSSTGGSPQFYAELYKVDASNNFTLVGSGSTNPEGITNGTTIDQYFTSIPVPQTSLLVTDRLAIRIFVIPAGRTITLHTENSNLCEVLTTLSTGLNALNGLTSQVQYFATGTSGTDFAISSATDTHTFNLPTASATNRGALSSADWTTFNNKQAALTNPITGTGSAGQVAYFTGTTTQAGSNNLFWDNTRSSLGVGVTPSAWSVLRGLQVGLSASLAGYAASTEGAFFASNSFYDGGNFKYQVTGFATTYLQISGTHRFQTAASGTAGNNITFTEAMRLHTTGNLVLGGTVSSDTGEKLQVNGTAKITGNVQIGSTAPTIASGYTSVAVGNATNGGNIDLFTGATRVASWNNTSIETFFGTRSNTPLAITTNAAEVARFFANGNFRIGANVADAGFRLDVNGTMRVSDVTSILGSSTSAYITTIRQTNTTSDVSFGLLVSAGTTANDVAFRVQNAAQNTNFFSVLGNGAATFSSSVQAGGGTTNASAILQADSTTKGFLPPRMTTTQKLAITSPATGLQVYDTTLNLMSFYNSTSWVTGGSGSQIINYPILAATSTWASGTTYNFGATTSAVDTTGGRNRGVFNKSGIVKSITIVFRATNAPTSSSTTLDFKKATGNGTLSTVASTTISFPGQVVYIFNWTGLNISVAENDTYEFTIVPTAGHTNSLITGHIEVQLT
jgi:hypothetical protein